VPPLFEILGIAGIVIAMLAYLPQVVHLAKEHCSAGISRRAWAMWLASSLLIGALALHRRDPVFILLQISNVTSTAIVLFLSWRYRGMVCEAQVPPAARTGDGRPLASRAAAEPGGNAGGRAEVLVAAHSLPCVKR
jgi:uncharacterized protein with PQ loop repeat